MTTFNQEQYNLAVEGWMNSCGSYSTIQSLIPTNYVFNLSTDQIDWVKERNKCNDFCVDMGIYNDQVIIILSPLNSDGQKMPVDEYPYSELKELQQDLRLVETEEYTLVKNAVLSKDLRTIDDDSDMYFPVSNKPIMEQDKAIEAIEMWRNEGMTWFYRECTEFQGARVFRKFYVPSENLSPPKPGLTNIICSFGLKFSDVYQRVLPTLIFISFYADLENTGSIQTISNTYDWSQPCPPICNI